MTTIAYKNGVIAYDSSMSCGAQVVYDNYEKMVIIEGVRFFMCGTPAHQGKFATLFFGRAVATEELDMSVLAVDRNGQVWHCSVESHKDQHSFWKLPLMENEPYAIGSGQEYALGAMDAGADVETAVKIAAKRDVYTGGAIKVFDVNAYKRTL